MVGQWYTATDRDELLWQNTKDLVISKINIYNLFNKDR